MTAEETVHYCQYAFPDIPFDMATDCDISSENTNRAKLKNLYNSNLTI